MFAFSFVSHLLRLCLLHDTLQEYKHFLEEAKKRDHRILGKAQELFFFHELRYLSTALCFLSCFHISNVTSLVNGELLIVFTIVMLSPMTWTIVNCLLI